MSSNLESLQDELSQNGIDVDLGENTINERVAYKRALEALASATDDDDAKKKQAKVKALASEYFLAFHKYVLQMYPHLLFEIGNDKAYWLYDEELGYYKEINASVVRDLVAKLLLDEELRGFAKESSVKDILTRFKAEYNEQGKDREDFSEQTDWIHVQNGWVNMKTRKFKKHTPEMLSTATLAVDYKKNAKAPVWLKTIEHLAEGDETQELILQEFAGYCLTFDAHLDKSLILVGEGQSGKSTFANTIYSLLGNGDASSTDLESINGTFGVYPLVGKKLNWIDEMPTTKYLESQRLKRLISGEPTTAQKKYGDEFEFTPTAKFLWTMNEMPRLADTSNGSYRRFIIVTCNNVYTDEDKDPQIDKKLAEEFSGILNWMMDGLQSLYERGDFEVSEKNDEAIIEYRKENSPLLEFIDMCFDPVAVPDEKVKAGGVPAMALYNGYKKYCDNTGRKPKSMTYFGKELTTGLKHLGYNVEKRRGGQGMMYFGLMPNDNRDATGYLSEINMERDFAKAGDKDGQVW